MTKAMIWQVLNDKWQDFILLVTTELPCGHSGAVVRDARGLWAEWTSTRKDQVILNEASV
jgi:hypothetical protein